MKTLKCVTTMVVLLVTFTSFAQDDKNQKIINAAEEAKMNAENMDAGLDLFFNNASGYVIFPNVGEGAFIVGGASGNGAVYENGILVGMADLKKLDVGLQAGGQTFTEIIFFETEDALNHFKQGKYEFSAEAKAIALEEGVAANANYNDGVVVFVIPKKGLMADLSVGGQRLAYVPLK
ncbi:lipid-binding SYLF domain-containing protein [Arenibacter certesii]|nr:lipid-binding SYLF domain-containing protein [Arenibacter certesii]